MMRVPGSRQGDRHRKDGQPVDDVEADQQRDAETVALDGEPLKAIDLGRIGEEQQRTGNALLQLQLHHLGLVVGIEVQYLLHTFGQTEVEILSQLPGLLVGCHLREQSSTCALIVIGSPLHIVVAWHRAARIGVGLRPRHRSFPSPVSDPVSMRSVVTPIV